MLSSLRNLWLFVAGLLIFMPAWSEEEGSSSGRQIEEMIVCIGYVYLDYCHE